MVTTGVPKHPTKWHSVVPLNVHRHVRQGRCRWHLVPGWSLLHAFDEEMPLLLHQCTAVRLQIELFYRPLTLTFQPAPEVFRQSFFFSWGVRGVRLGVSGMSGQGCPGCPTWGVQDVRLFRDSFFFSLLSSQPLLQLLLPASIFKQERSVSIER